MDIWQVDGDWCRRGQPGVMDKGGLGERVLFASGCTVRSEPREPRPVHGRPYSTMYKGRSLPYTLVQRTSKAHTL
jgi:hypothetical protein